MNERASMLGYGRDLRDLGGLRMQVRDACCALGHATLALRAGQCNQAGLLICKALHALHVAEAELAPAVPRLAPAVPRLAPAVPRLAPAVPRLGKSSAQG